MTKCIQHIRDFFEYALYKFTITYLLTYICYIIIETLDLINYHILSLILKYHKLCCYIKIAKIL